MSQLLSHYRGLLRVLPAALTLLITLSPYGPAASAQAVPGWPAEWQSDSSFYDLWSRTDGPVASGAAARSWQWGPLPFAVANEPYKQSATGKRLVQYFDKGRMEINDPGADHSTEWFVTSGLLVREMVSGRVQVGDSEFEDQAPAALPVAGDSGSPDAPGYAAFGAHIGPSADAQGSLVGQLLNKGGSVSAYAPAGDATPFTVAAYDTTSQHNIPAVFVDWLSKKGIVYENGQLVQDQLIDPLFVLGHPITDAYWANILVGGAPETVLVQLFERRALTYNPNNPPEMQVEMANVGRTYYEWRYGQVGTGPAVAGNVGAGDLTVGGWNWPTAGTVTVRIEQAGDALPVAGPSYAQADQGGHFSLHFNYNESLQLALQARASLRIVAESGSLTTALPLAGIPPGVSTHIEGIITLMQTVDSGTRIIVQSFDRKQWLVSVQAQAAIKDAEGRARGISHLDAGVGIALDGTLSQGVVNANGLTALSLSGLGARISYSWNADGASLFVSGTGWPGEHEIDFALGTAQSQQPSFGKLSGDSRGNISGNITVPGNFASRTDSWLFAAGKEGGAIVAQVAVPVEAIGSVSMPAPTSLFLSAKEGSEAGGVGSYCANGKCSKTSGVPLQAEGLIVGPGEVLGLRDETGSNAVLGQTASVLNVALYPAQTSGAPFDVSAPFVPAGTAIYSTGDLPGRPFSISLPGNLSSGQYVIMVTVTWPDSAGGKNNGVYGFLIQIP